MVLGFFLSWYLFVNAYLIGLAAKIKFKVSLQNLKKSFEWNYAKKLIERSERRLLELETTIECFTWRKVITLAILFAYLFLKIDIAKKKVVKSFKHWSGASIQSCFSVNLTLSSEISFMAIKKEEEAHHMAR